MLMPKIKETRNFTITLKFIIENYKIYRNYILYIGFGVVLSLAERRRAGDKYDPNCANLFVQLFFALLTGIVTKGESNDIRFAPGVLGSAEDWVVQGDISKYCELKNEKRKE